MLDLPAQTTFMPCCQLPLYQYLLLLYISDTQLSHAARHEYEQRPLAIAIAFVKYRVTTHDGMKQKHLLTTLNSSFSRNRKSQYLSVSPTADDAFKFLSTFNTARGKWKTSPEYGKEKKVDQRMKDERKSC